MAKKKAKRNTDAESEALEKAVIDKRTKYSEQEKENKRLTGKDFVSSGVTKLNLALTNHYKRGLAKGRYYMFVGDSDTGKSFVLLGVLAEAANDINFDNYRLIYDDVEGGALMDISEYYGEKLAERLEYPHEDLDGRPCSSETIEDFYDALDDADCVAVEDGRPFIYILDSMDALSSEQADKKDSENKGLREKGKESKGNYGDGKAKYNSQHLRSVTQKLNKTGSILIIVCQSRDDLHNTFSIGTHSGGRALKFFAAAQIWTKQIKTLVQTVRKTKRKIGITPKFIVTKNRFTGLKHEVSFPIYYSYGVDDTRACIEYLCTEKEFSKVKNTINCKGFDFKGSVEACIEYFEEDEKRLEELHQLCQKVWNDIIDTLKVKGRRKKYN